MRAGDTAPAATVDAKIRPQPTMSAAATTTIPFALLMEQECTGTNGFEIVHVFAEFADNAADAHSRQLTVALLPEPGTLRATLLVFDTGDGAADLDSLYSIGNRVVKKTAPCRGLKNYGHRAAIGRLTPDNILHVTRTAGAPRSSTLTFKLGELREIIAAAPTPCDYRAIDARIPTLFGRSVGGLTDEIRDQLTALRARMAATPANYASAMAFVDSVLANTQPTFHAMVLTWEEAPATLHEEILAAFQSYRLSYYKALQDGFEFNYLPPPAATPLHYRAADAIDPLGDAWPRITCALEFRGEEMAQLTVATATAPTATQLWITPNSSSLRITDVAPIDWTAAAVTGRATIAVTVVSSAEEDAQKALAGPLFEHRDDLRGVYVRYQDHILGPPLFPAVGWGAVRNAGGVRVEISTTDQAFAEDYFHIPAKKHSMTYSNLHPLLQALLTHLVKKVVIKKYSYYKVNGGCGVAAWDLNQFCQQLRGEGFSSSPLPPPPPPPAIQQIRDHCNRRLRSTRPLTAEQLEGYALMLQIVQDLEAGRALGVVRVPGH
jgi:hypothetical protein